MEGQSICVCDFKKNDIKDPVVKKHLGLESVPSCKIALELRFGD